MPRRRRASDFEKGVDVFARLPWLVCVALIPVAYIAFDALAKLQPAPPKDLTQLAAGYLPTVLRVAGMIGRFLVPLLLAFAAFKSWAAKRRRQRLLDEAERRTDDAPLRALSWREFEQVVGAHFERLGYAVSFTPEGPDGGVDAVARKGRETFFVQCKQWQATKVGVAVVRELFGVVAARGATGGFVVSIGEFTEDARAFAAGRNIELVQAHRLLGTGPALRPNAPVKPTASPAENSGEPLSEPPPPCPKCRAPMVRRVAGRGAVAGQPFYGCSRYPQCRATLSA